MAKYLTIEPRKCIGCSQCALTCSLLYIGEFNPAQAFVRITRFDRSGLYEISFSSQCKSCRKCGQVCPSGALGVVETASGEEE